MPNPENLRGHGFDDKPERINRNGRPKKIYTILKETGYSADDMRTAFGEIPFYTKKELKKIIADDNAPAITIVLAKACLNAIASGNYKELKDIAEQFIGKAKETKEVKADISGAKVIIKSEGDEPEIE